MRKLSGDHTPLPYTEFIGIRGEPPELKHLSRARKRHQPRFRQQWRANAEEDKPRVEILSGYGLLLGLNLLAEWHGKANRRG